MGERQDLKCSELELGQLHVVALEGLAIGMVGVALELDNEASLGPVGVDLKALDQDVHLRGRQAGVPNQIEE
jgi:hypothetical protein